MFCRLFRAAEENEGLRGIGHLLGGKRGQREGRGGEQETRDGEERELVSSRSPAALWRDNAGPLLSFT